MRTSQRVDPQVKKILPQQFQHVNLNAAGIDVGSEFHFVAVPPDRDKQSVRKFSAFTGNIITMADWLQKCGVDTVVMESTGVYWIPLFELLESRGMKVLLVDPRRLKHVPGRKTDVVDCQWLQQLHAFGLLSGAFRPEEQVCVLRSYMRQRGMLLQYAAHHIQHMQKALHQMNIKLDKVITDITGVTGMAIINAILAGERDAERLAALWNERCQNTEATIAQALQGNWREEHLFVLQQALTLYRTYHEQVAQCDRKIQAHLSTFEDKSGGEPLPLRPKKTKRNRNDPALDSRTLMYQASGVDLTRIDGIDGHTAMKIISEIGLDMTPWRTYKHFTSWMGLCPGNKESAGRKMSGRTKPCANRVATILRIAAQTLHRSKTALGAYYRRMKTRLGASKAITATAHKLARLVYFILKHGWGYVDPGQDWYDKQYQERIMKSLQKRAKDLGFQLVPLIQAI